MAVYTHVDHQTLEHHLQAYDIGALVDFDGVSEGVENTNYILQTDKNKYVLTLFEKRVAAQELPFYLGFMDYLRDAGVPSPAVIAARDGKNILPLMGKPSVITQFLEGAWLREDKTPDHLAQLGVTLALMHSAGRDFKLKRSNTMSLPAWKSLIHACFDGANTLEDGLYDFLETEITHVEKNWPKFLPKGAIHADLFPDNVFFKDGSLSGVIDFYFACWDSLAYDLMLTLNAWCFERDGSFDIEKSRAFLRAYQAARPLTPAEQKALPFFGRAAALRIIATRLYDWLNPVDGAIVRAKDPMEHVRILRFHQNVKSLADYGLE